MRRFLYIFEFIHTLASPSRRGSQHVLFSHQMAPADLFHEAAGTDLSVCCKVHWKGKKHSAHVLELSFVRTAVSSTMINSYIQILLLA